MLNTGEYKIIHIQYDSNENIIYNFTDVLYIIFIANAKMHVFSSLGKLNS